MIGSLIFVGAVAAAMPCESLKSISLPGTTITAAELVAAGPYTPPPLGPAGGPVAVLSPRRWPQELKLRLRPDGAPPLELRLRPRGEAVAAINRLRRRL